MLEFRRGVFPIVVFTWLNLVPAFHISLPVQERVRKAAKEMSEALQYQDCLQQCIWFQQLSRK